ncbi:hypothetical protein [Desulfosarcina cetonica]|uniref:hypothetical protein n=1 Tax=Desulfosarcina cetonica TaxID=90730 RepID=UPI000A6B42F2|nr:hypothetical protein [Desulfosarcina cetonica]
MRILKRLARPLVAPAVFLLLALAATWPLAMSPASRLPMGMESAATVPLFNVWTVWWNADRAAAGYGDYWDAPIFHPQKGAFSFSEPMPLSVVAAPVIWITGSRILAYNVLLILSLWFNGWATHCLLRRLHLYRPVPWIGGAMVTLLPLIHSWLGVLQLVPVFGILWTVAALYRFSLRPAPMGGIRIGVALAVTFLMCAYYGLFLVLPLTLSAGWLLGRRMRRWRMWSALLPGMLVGVLICLPFAKIQTRTASDSRPPHTQRYLAQFSAMVPDYLVSPWPHGVGVLETADTAAYAGYRLCPGYLKWGCRCRPGVRPDVAPPAAVDALLSIHAVNGLRPVPGAVAARCRLAALHVPGRASARLRPGPQRLSVRRSGAPDGGAAGHAGPARGVGCRPPAHSP